MKYLRLLVAATLVAQFTYAQGIKIGVFGGTASYSGDLISNTFLPKKVTKPSVGITANYPINSRINLKSGITYGIVGGADRYADDPSRVRRNLSFETKLVELSTVGEVYLLNMENTSFSPYGFVGAAVFHFNPYAYDTKGEKVFLRPLSTEGQGLPAYPDRQPYKLFQFAIPYGAGLKFRVNEKMDLGLEVGFRKLFTEYIDDVSTQYVDYEELLNAKGPLAVEMAYRGDELNQGVGNSFVPYPPAGTLRGDPSHKDAYYFSGLHVTYLFSSNEKSSANYGKYGRKRGGMGCPTNVY